MQWENLLSLNREGDTHKRLRTEQDETRLGFEVDYDRIIFSAAFRSLQDKTQVIPLSKTSFVHTRLTHSLEVAVVGRSLGRLAGQKLLARHPHLREVLGHQFYDFGAIVAAAALAHDIGNPPFGHTGEKALGDYFLNGPGARFKSAMSAACFHDLTHFEGNANGFSILTQHAAGSRSGLRLSAATLGAFTKYPKESLPHKPTRHIADKKFGIFQKDKSFFMQLADTLALPSRSTTHMAYARHPLAFLVEAADDICYTLIDFEDGINLGWLPEDSALEFLINLVKDTIQTNVYRGLKTTAARVAYLRALAISTLIKEAIEVFLNNEKALLEGSFASPLLEKSKFKAQINDIISTSVTAVYKHPEVIQKELAGYSILHELLDKLSYAIERTYRGEERQYDKLLLANFSIVPEKQKTVYEQQLLACQKVAQLSDAQALHGASKLKGNI